MMFKNYFMKNYNIRAFEWIRFRVFTLKTHWYNLKVKLKSRFFGQKSPPTKFLWWPASSRRHLLKPKISLLMLCGSYLTFVRCSECQKTFLIFWQNRDFGEKRCFSTPPKIDNTNKYLKWYMRCKKKSSSIMYLGIGVISGEVFSIDLKEKT